MNAWLPFIVVTAMSLAGVFLTIFSGFGFLLLIASITFSILFLLWVVLIIRSLLASRWKSLVSVLALGTLESLMIFLLLRNGDEIHFHIMRPSYMTTIARDRGFPKIEYWDWGGEDSFSDTLVYVNGAPLTSALNDDSSIGKDCKSTAERLSKHFYLIDLRC